VSVGAAALGASRSDNPADVHGHASKLSCQHVGHRYQHGRVELAVWLPVCLAPFNKDTNEAPKFMRDIASPSMSWAMTDADKDNAGSRAAYYPFLPEALPTGRYAINCSSTCTLQQ
jgi:hypothetical protein